VPFKCNLRRYSEAVRKRRRALLLDGDGTEAADETFSAEELAVMREAKAKEEEAERRAQAEADATAEGIMDYAPSDGPLIDSYTVDTGGAVYMLNPVDPFMA
jgi:hypothetical protein